MNTILKQLRAGTTVVLLALVAACNQDHPTSPVGGIGGLPEDAPGGSALELSSNPNVSMPELGACDRLRAPQGSHLAFHTFARGVQIYRWDGTTWTYVAPEATLSASANGEGVVGKHYAGPTWETNGGSTVSGSVIDRCTPDASAIPWLSLAGYSSNGRSVFVRVTFIQRVNTVGGLLPVVPGTYNGEIARVPYSAEYFFYRAP